MSSNVIVIIKIIEDSNSELDRLNLEDNLLNIRKELENCNTINDTLSFSQKCSNDKFSVIKRENEEKFLLKEILEIDDKTERKTLYLTGIRWNNLNNKKHKLDYGCTMSFDGIKRSNNRAFTMNDCELTEIGAEGYKKEQLIFKSKEDWIKKANLFVEADDINFGKKNLKLTNDFKNNVTFAINSEDHREFKKITEKYGQFIPTEVVLGGRVYSKDSKSSSEISKEDSKGGSIQMGIGSSNVKIRGNSSESKSNSKFYSCNHLRILGGEHPDEKDFDEKAWIESLKNYQNWSCIEFKSPISIFQLLPDDLCKKAFKSIGKRILYTWTEDHDYYLNELGEYRIFELKKVPDDVLGVILDKDSECDIFATVFEETDSKNVFFTCQIFREEQKAKPSILIHGIQKEFKKCQYKLKIKIMVIGYDTNFKFILSNTTVRLVKKDVDLENPCKFYSIPSQLGWDLVKRDDPFFGIPVLSNLDSANNSLVVGHVFRKSQSDNKLKIDTFSYCSKKELYDNLPKFTFCTLIISDKSTSNTYESLPLKISTWDMWGKTPFIDLKESSNFDPKYVSLCLSEDNNYKPMFLNQKSQKINVENVNCRCINTCFICMNKNSEITNQSNIECKIYSLSDNIERMTHEFFGCPS